MAKRTEAMDRSIKKYEAEKIERISIRFPKGKREIVQAHAAAQGESMNAFINRAINETMARDAETAPQKTEE